MRMALSTMSRASQRGLVENLMFAPRPVDYYTSSLSRPSGPACSDQLVALHGDLGSGRDEEGTPCRPSTWRFPMAASRSSHDVVVIASRRCPGSK